MPLIILSVVAGFLILVSTPSGIGTTPDSVNYISAAKSFESGNGLLYFNGELFAVWTPGYAIILSGLFILSNFFDIELLTIIQLQNILLFGLLIFTSGLMMRQYVKSEVLVLIGVLFILLSHPHILVYTFAWSECAFLVLITLFFYYIPKLRSYTRFQDLIPLIIVTALIPFQRYPGALFVGLGGISILYLIRLPLLKRFWYAVLYGILSSIPVGLYLVRNLILTQNLLGPREDLSNPLIPQVAYTYELMSSWFTTNPLNIGYLDLLIFAVIVFIAVLFTTFRRYQKISLETLGNTVAIPLPSLTIVLFIVLYLTLAVWVTSITISPNLIEHRVLSPLYSPIIVLILIVFEKLAQFLNQRFDGKYPGTIIVAIGLLVLLVYPAWQALNDVVYRRSIDCCQESWGDTALISWINDQNIEGIVYSNTYVPMTTTQLAAYSIPSTQLEFDNLLTVPIYILWFEHSEQFYCEHPRFCIETDYTPETLRADYDVDVLFEDAVGGVYRVTQSASD